VRQAVSHLLVVRSPRCTRTKSQSGKAASSRQSVFCQFAPRSRVLSGPETFWCDVGQVGNRRRVGNPPLSDTGQCVGGPIANRPQDAILPAWRFAPPKWDEKPDRPIANRPQDAILPYITSGTEAQRELPNSGSCDLCALRHLRALQILSFLLRVSVVNNY